MKKETLEKMTIEEAFENVENTMEQLRSDEISLEDSFAFYKDGMEILKACAAKIDKVEKEVLKLNGDGETDAF